MEEWLQIYLVTALSKSKSRPFEKLWSFIHQKLWTNLNLEIEVLQHKILEELYTIPATIISNVTQPNRQKEKLAHAGTGENSGTWNNSLSKIFDWQMFFAKMLILPNIFDVNKKETISEMCAAVWCLFYWLWTNLWLYGLKKVGPHRIR